MGDEHTPVLAAEALAGLGLEADGYYVDATFGRGGHTALILQALGQEGRLLAIDRDPQAIAAGAKRFADEVRLALVHASLPDLGALVPLHAEGRACRVVLFDLGVSSPQLDDARRGFSFRADGPLDMRMDPSEGESAAQWLAMAEQEQIREVVRNYGEERFAKQIAAAIVAARRSAPIERTGQLADLVAKAVRTREPGQDPATRTFQALRIHVNRELEEVSLMLPRALEHLEIDARLAVISFHSLEDRIVKRFVQQAARPEVPRRLPLRESEMPQPALRIVGRAQRA